MPFMKTILIFIVSFVSVSVFAQANSFVDPVRQQMALEKLKTIVLPSSLVRKNIAESVQVNSQCATQDQEILSIDPNTNESMKVTLKSYVSPKANRTVIVMPPTGGVNELDYKYAQAFCDAGLNAIILMSWVGDSLQQIDPGMHDRNALRGVTAIRSLLTTIESTQTVGIFGTSVGGILGALAIGLEERLVTGLFVVAGGDMTEVIAQSTEKNLAALRDLRMQEYGFSDIGDYFQLLDENVVIEPLDFANYSGAKKIGFVLSTADLTVPTKNQYDLINAWGGEDLIFKTAPPFFNHFAAILHSSYWWTDDITAYFVENL